MAVSVEFIPGPPVTEVNRENAERGLQRHSAIQKGASYAIEQLDGRWVAAIVHEAADAPPFGGGPADSSEEAPGPKSEGPDDAEPSAGPENLDNSDSNEDSDKKKKGGDLSEVLNALHQIADALGVPLQLGDSPVPGADGADVPPGPGVPPGPPGAPAPPGGPSEQHVVHERVTKPGETPPGGTPIGAPAFASVREDHPWARVAGKVASFQVGPTKIGDAPIHKIAEELDSLASEIGYRYKLREGVDENGDRVATAIITRH